MHRVVCKSAVQLGVNGIVHSNTTPLCLSDSELIATVRVLDTDDGENESGVAVCCSRHLMLMPNCLLI